MDLNKAIEYISRQANEVELARLRFILAGERPSLEVVARLFAGQQSDGGFQPFWAQDYSSLDATCFRLAQAGQLGLAETQPEVQRALRFLERRQSQDGSWEEESQVANLTPPWATPGDLAAKLYLTANCGFWLALVGGDQTAASKAAGFLQMHLGADGRLPGFVNTHWLAGGLWTKLGWLEPAGQVFGTLSRRLRQLPASDLAWLITTLEAAGAARNHPLVSEAAASLELLQGSDGSWPGADGPGHDVHTTLEALRALWFCGRRPATGMHLRPVSESDLPVFFEHQRDPTANRMAAFQAREREAFLDHWARIMADPSVILRTIVYEGQVAGNVVSFVTDGDREVGYWIGQEYWGKGIATQALRAFLQEITDRPLYAHAAKHNLGSIRVLEKCGFVANGEDSFSNERGERIEEIILIKVTG